VQGFEYFDRGVTVSCVWIVFERPRVVMGCALNRGPANGSGMIDASVTTHLSTCPYLRKRVRTNTHAFVVLL